MTDTTRDDETANDQPRTDGTDTDDPSTDRDAPESADRPDEATERPAGLSSASDGGNWDAAATSAAGERDRGSERDVDRDGGRDIGTYVEWAAFGILCLLALVATFRFYFAASEAIRVWFSPDFVPVFQAVFNLLVLVASVAGISVLVRRIA
ncbi:hypothetical protein [Halosimplex amylolyticum]|uniref:hypothetical protein n=1 Tax=Halosimplex amylolyticum TaxID=3396616 RepID=UPI003F5482DF